MFSDIAVGETCVSCHNNGPEAPKADWKVGDITGATTRSYPKGGASFTEALTLVNALRRSYRATYEECIAKASTFVSSAAVLGLYHGYIAFYYK